jgi:hypothetical protein
LILTKTIGWATFWAIFSQTHLVTLIRICVERAGKVKNDFLVISAGAEQQMGATQCGQKCFGKAIKIFTKIHLVPTYIELFCPE